MGGIEITAYTGTSIKVRIPEKIEGEPVVSINSAFDGEEIIKDNGIAKKNNGIMEVYIPNGIKNIGNRSFYKCTGLTSMTIPDSVAEIGSSAFSGCIGLTSVTIPDSVAEIGSSAFSGCIGLTNVIIGNSVEEIGDNAFRDCTGITSIVIPGSVKINPSMFIGCTNLTNVTMNIQPSIGGFVFLGGIFWRILDMQNGNALIISENILFDKEYHAAGREITWEYCELRQYLNLGFYENSFSTEEKFMIIETQNANYDNPKYGTYGGNNTSDKIFLLSIEEANKYFTSDSARVAYNRNTGEASWWWLRSPGMGTSFAAGVYSDGEVSSSYYHDGVTSVGGVRPALWLNLES